MKTYNKEILRHDKNSKGEKCIFVLYVNYMKICLWMNKNNKMLKGVILK